MTDEEIRVKIREIVADYTELPISEIDDDANLAQIVDWSAFPGDQQAGHIFEDFIAEFRIVVPGQEFSEWAVKKGIPGILKPMIYLPYILWIREQFVIDQLSVNEMVEIAKAGEWRAF